jgi:hypothetical protein
VKDAAYESALSLTGFQVKLREYTLRWYSTPSKSVMSEPLTNALNAEGAFCADKSVHDNRIAAHTIFVFS